VIGGNKIAQKTQEKIEKKEVEETNHETLILGIAIMIGKRDESESPGA